MSNKPLSGIRILDFGSFLAGPVAAMILGSLGAEVIKVENPKKPDAARMFVTAAGVRPPDLRIGAQLYDTSNFNKLGICVDISTPKGKEIMYELVKNSDVFMENMRPGAIAKYGFSYDELKAINPSIIYLSSSACGQTGPENKYIGYAATFANKSGLGHLTGYADSIPGTFVGSIDVRSSVLSVIGILTAINYRDKTGKGQYIDVSSQEAISSQLGDVYLDYITNNNIQGRMANKRNGYAPQGAYPTCEKDEWVAISVENDEQWVNFCKAIGKDELANDPKYATYEKRFQNSEELDEIISAWTKDQYKYGVVEKLQALKVPSGPVLNSEGLSKDPHIAARKDFTPVPHRDMGIDYAITPPWRFSKTPASVDKTSPLLGEHTTQVLKNLCGKTDKEIAELAEEKVIRRIFD